MLDLIKLAKNLKFYEINGTEVVFGEDDDNSLVYLKDKAYIVYPDGSYSEQEITGTQFKQLTNGLEKKVIELDTDVAFLLYLFGVIGEPI